MALLSVAKTEDGTGRDLSKGCPRRRRTAPGFAVLRERVRTYVSKRLFDAGNGNSSNVLAPRCRVLCETVGEVIGNLCLEGELAKI